VPLIGIYSLDIDQAGKPPEEQTVERLAAFDTETGEWMYTSQSDILGVVYPEYLAALREQGPEAVRRYLKEFESGTTLVEFESEVDATIEVVKPMVDPTEVEIGRNAPRWRYDLEDVGEDDSTPAPTSE